MGIFNKIIKKLRGGAAAPNEHGPAVKFAAATLNKGCACGGSCACGTKGSKPVSVAPVVKIEKVSATTDRNPATIPVLPSEPVVVKAKRVTAAEKEATSAAKEVVKSDYTATVKKQAVKKSTTPKDGDGDGKINDGKKNEAKAPVKKPAAKKPTPKKK